MSATNQIMEITFETLSLEAKISFLKKHAHLLQNKPKQKKLKVKSRIRVDFYKPC